jgi:hypothetical protein
VQHVLREANKNTLDHVSAFLQQAAGEDTYVLLCLPPRNLGETGRERVIG